MTAPRDYHGPFRPPCPAWATRADIEAALALGYPLDESYLRRALELTHEETEGPNSGLARERAHRKQLQADVSDLSNSVDEAREAQSVAEDEAKRVRKTVRDLIPSLPPEERWPAMRAFCTELDLGDVRVLRLADLAGAELEHARRLGRQLGARFWLVKPFEGYDEVRIVGFDRYGSFARHILLAPSDATKLADLDPLVWLVDEYRWGKEHKPELEAAPAKLVRPGRVS